MRHCIIMLSLLALVTVVNAQEHPLQADVSKLTIRIDTPVSGSTVNMRHYVKGKVTDTDADVWVVVLDEKNNEYWPQASATVDDSDSTWSVLAQFGEANTPAGHPYIIRAFVNSEMKLTTGVRIENWPKAAARSNIMHVTR